MARRGDSMRKSENKRKKIRVFFAKQTQKKSSENERDIGKEAAKTMASCSMVVLN